MMQEYTLPRELYNLLEETFGQKQKAELFARAIESVIREIQRKANEEILEKKEYTKIEVKEELRTELITNERFSALETKMDERFKVVDEKFSALETKMDERFKGVDEKFSALEIKVDERFSALEAKVDERFKVVEEKFKALSFKLNVFLAIALVALTFANPTFAKILEKLFGF